MHYLYKASIQKTVEMNTAIGKPEMCFMQMSHDLGNPFILDLISKFTPSVAVLEEQKYMLLEGGLKDEKKHRKDNGIEQKRR